ncbi:MAG: MFS transporter [Thermoleophilia bacterium]|nr:MFS transporter [Thermoleophilia bacterium]
MSDFPLPELSARRWWVLIIASIGVFLATLDSTILSVALPAISEDLVLTYSEALWVQAAYLLVVTVLLIPIGRWSETRGPYFFYWVGTLLFGVFSVMVAVSFNGMFMIAARALQGVGGAMILTTSAAIVAAVFPPQERGRALALNMLGSTIGQTLGPPIGGVLVTHMGWPWVFLIKVPAVAITLIAGWSLLGAERRDLVAATRSAGADGTDTTAGSGATSAAGGGRAGVDIRGAALLGMTLAALFIPLIFSPLWGWDSWAVIGPLASVVVLAAVFVYVEKRTRDPILDMGVFKRSRTLTAMTVASILYMSAAYGVPIFTAVFLVVVQGRSAQAAGFILLLQPALLTIFTPLAGRLSDRFGSRGLTALGMLVTATGMVQLSVFTVSTPIWQVLAATATLGIGIALFSTPNFSAIMGAVDRSELGVASGMFATSRFCGMGISIAVLGAIAASKLGPEGGRVILLGARAGVENAEAFTAGYREAMLVGAAFTVVGAFVSLIRERRRSSNAAPNG